MTELKFKLKKDGKCVGYMLISDGNVLVRSPNSQPEYDWENSYQSEYSSSDGSWVEPTIEWDSIHPFVCLDRNDKEVYEGDRIHARSNTGPQTVTWSILTPRFVLIGAKTRPENGQWFDPEDIELIPDEVLP